MTNIEAFTSNIACGNKSTIKIYDDKNIKQGITTIDSVIFPSPVDNVYTKHIKIVTAKGAKKVNIGPKIDTQ